jgi:hypothetical protein
MMLLAYLVIATMVRLMVNMILYSMLDIFRLNHIVLPPPGWKLEAIKIIFTVMLLTPIFGTMEALQSLSAGA